MASYNAGRVRGYAAWTALFTDVQDGIGPNYRVVQKLTSYVGGEGNPPTDHLNEYLKSDGGFTTDISLAVDVRGERGVKGEQGIQGIPGITTTNMSTNRLLGRTTAGTGTPENIEAVGLTLASGKMYNAVGVSNAGLLNVVVVNNPAGGQWKGSFSETGSIKIKLPTSGPVASMMCIKGTIYSFNLKQTTTFTICAYPSSMTAGVSVAFVSAVNTPKFSVRFYTDGNNRYIYIGELNSVWVYPSLTIETVIASYTGADIPSIASGWVISLEATAFTGTQNAIETELRPQFNPSQIISEFVAASGVNTPLTSTMSLVQMLQNLQAQVSDRYKTTESDLRFLPQKIYSPTIGVLVQTAIPSVNDNMFSGEIKGNGYTSNVIDISFQGYNYNSGNTILNAKGISKGENIPITVFNYNGFVCLHFVPPSTANTVMVEVYGGMNNFVGNQVTSITAVAKPSTGITRETTFTPRQSILTDGTQASSVLLGNGTYKILSDFTLKSEGSMFRGANAIAGGVNLNSLTVTGYYIQQANGSATLALNYPATRAGFLIVYSSLAANDYTTQIYIDYGTGETWNRSNNGGVSWSTWKKTVQLGPDNKIPLDQIPATAIVDVFAVASQAAMLALTAQKGDIAVRSDISKTFILSADPATTLGNWMELLSPTGGVTSIAGFTGPVTKAQLAIDQINNTSDASKPVSIAQQAALDTKAPIRYSSIVTVSASKTLALTDENTYQRVTATCNITVPPNSSVAVPVGARIDFLVTGTFVATFVEGSGVTISKKSNLSATGYSACTIIKTGTNTWDLIGN